LAVRFGVPPATALSGAAGRILGRRPGRLPVAAMRLGSSGGRPIRVASHEVLSPSAYFGRVALSGVAGIRTIPLRRFASLRSSIESVFGTAHRAIALAVFRCCARQVRPSALSSRTPPARVMHRRFLFRAVFRYPRPGPLRGLPGVAVPAALMGLRPSQCCSCPRVSGVSAFRAHLPFPERPSRVHFIGRSTAESLATPTLKNGRSRTFSAAPGFYPRGQSVPACQGC
jgi:hypothetical protein